MRILARIMLVLFLLLAFNSAAYAEDEMLRVEFAGYSFLMEHPYTNEDKDGKTMIMHSGKNCTYWVTIMNAPCSSEESTAMVVNGTLDGACEGVLIGLAGTQESRSVISLHSRYPGREIKVKFTQRKIVGYLQQRIYLINRMLVSLSVGRMEGQLKSDPTNADRFLNSLKVVPKKSR